ncbi:MAG: hypothetical protein AAFN13_01100 [Bacteroidota bacterium]
MLEWDDPRWADLEGGYRVPYDPRPALQRIKQETEVQVAWEELWEELHHQGDVGTASFAAVPHLVQIHAEQDVPNYNVFAMLCVIERARSGEGNPAIPDWLKKGYEQAWQDIIPLALRDIARSESEDLLRSAFSAIAIARGLQWLSTLIFDFSEAETQEMIEAYLGA